MPPPTEQKATRTIPLYNVVWAELSEFEIIVHYARAASKSVVRPAFINYSVEKTSRAKAEAWIGQLLNAAYGRAQRCKRIKVLINPFGGQGSAQKYYTKDIEPILAAARCHVDVEKTQYSGHAVDLAAEKIKADDWDVIACCSGDGVPHEVWNGLAKKKDAARSLAQIAVVQLPCGSGNALSWNLNGTGSPSLAALAVVKGIRTPMDLASVTQGDKRILSFLSQAVGIVAESDLGTEHLRFLGAARFTVGIVSRILTRKLYPADISVCVEIDDKPAIREAYQQEASKPLAESSSTTLLQSRGIPNPDEPIPPLQYGTVNDPLPSTWTPLTPYPNLGNFYAGNMVHMSTDAPFFKAALPSDGCFDLVTSDGDMSRLDYIKTLTAVENGTFFNMPTIKYRKVKGYRIVPKQPVKKEDGYISIDGERIPFEPFQVEVHRGLATVLSKTGHLYEASPP